MINEKLYESIYQAMRSVGRTVYREILQGLDDFNQESAPDTSKPQVVKSDRQGVVCVRSNTREG